MDGRIKALVDEIRNCGCTCDLMYGYNCSIHEPLDELEKLLEDFVPPEDVPRKLN
jgi:hypothetical protein